MMILLWIAIGALFGWALRGIKERADAAKNQLVGIDSHQKVHAVIDSYKKLTDKQSSFVNELLTNRPILNVNEAKLNEEYLEFQKEHEQTIRSFI
ncbi:hypothetical protein GCM10028807_42180 [Spirosoma daeguense]